MATSSILGIYKYLNTKYQELDMSIESISPTLFSIGSGGLIGFLVGFAIKRIFKILAVLVGLFLGALIYFESQGLISINWERLQEMTQSAVSMLAHTLTDTSQISVISGNLDWWTGGWVRVWYHEGLGQIISHYFQYIRFMKNNSKLCLVSSLCHEI